MMIDMRTFIPETTDLLVYKNLERPEWTVMEVECEDDSLRANPDDSMTVEFGRLVLSWLNHIKFIIEDSNHQAEDHLIKILFTLSDTEKEQWNGYYQDMVDLLMNIPDSTKERLDFYDKYKYIAYFFYSRVPFKAGDTIPKDITYFSLIVGHRIIGNERHQILRVHGWTSLFMLDLYELLFGKNAHYKIKRCKKCQSFFRTSQENKGFCIRCQAPSDKEYAEEYRNNSVNKLRKNILSKLENRDYTPEKEISDFKAEFAYYKDIIEKGSSDRPLLPTYDTSIRTMSDFIRWLESFDARIRKYKKGATDNGETNETRKWDGSDI